MVERASRQQAAAIDADDIPLMEDSSGVPVIYADGIADVEIQGTNVRVTYYEVRGVAPHQVRKPVLEMVRPVASLRGGLLGMVSRKRAQHGGGRSH